MPEIGKTYYIIAHAYHHYIGTVVDITPSFLVMKDCVKVMSDGRGWEKLLFEGIAKETACQHVTDGTELPYGMFPLHPFPHEIPKRKAGK